MSDYALVQLAVTEYARDYIAGLRRRKMSYRQIAKRFGCSHVWVSQIHQPEKFGHRLIGADIEHRLAELVHGGSVDALRKVALDLAHGVAVTNEDESGPMQLGTGFENIGKPRPESGGAQVATPPPTGDSGSAHGRTRKPKKPA